MLFDSRIFTSCIEDICNEIYSDPKFRSKCNEKFIEIVHVVKESFKDTLGLYQTSNWVADIMDSEMSKNFPKTVAISVTLKNLDEVIFSINSEEEFEPTLRTNAYNMLKDDKQFTQISVDNFLSQESFLPAYCFENNRLRKILYGSFAIW